MKKNKQTIFALSTPSGKSAIAIVRISGMKAFQIIKKISTNMPEKSNQATLNNIINKKKEIIDQTITTFYKSPKSYTGEDMVEISAHGGFAVIKKLLEELNNNIGLRIAEPGEFTKRAFENNKMDLTQVESISDLVNSETDAQRRQALNQLGGVLKKNIQEWTDRILKILADIEASIDFSDEDLPKDLIIRNKEQIRNIYAEISLQLKDNNFGEKIRSGFIVSVLGKPNVGKSSLINSIAKRDLSIVTEEPGTTRDAIELFVDYKGYPMLFFDTAGIRDAESKAEQIGVKKTIEISKNADVNLVLIENISDFSNYKAIKNKIFVQSKIDIFEKISTNNEIYYISSKNNYGIEALLEEVFKRIVPNISIENISVSRERHRKILNNTLVYLKKSLKPKNIDLLAEDIRLSLNEISKISGKKDVEDILDIIFSDFCIGK